MINLAPELGFHIRIYCRNEGFGGEPSAILHCCDEGDAGFALAKVELILPSENLRRVLVPAANSLRALLI